MKIIIAGSGQVGSHLAKLLSYESQEITLIDSNDEKLTFPNSQLDIRVVEGDCTSISILNKANVADADLFIGVTAAEAVNLTACYLAKQLGAKKTIARISNPELKENDNIDDLGDELSDVLFVLICLANQTGIDLEKSFKNNLSKKTDRDRQRHKSNKKLK